MFVRAAEERRPGCVLLSQMTRAGSVVTIATCRQTGRPIMPPRVKGDHADERAKRSCVVVDGGMPDAASSEIVRSILLRLGTNLVVSVIL